MKEVKKGNVHEQIGIVFVAAVRCCTKCVRRIEAIWKEEIKKKRKIIRPYF